MAGTPSPGHPPDTRESYVTRKASHLRAEVPGGSWIVPWERILSASPIPYELFSPLLRTGILDAIHLRTSFLSGKPSRSTLATPVSRENTSSSVTAPSAFSSRFCEFFSLRVPYSAGFLPMFTDVPLQAMLNNVRYHPLVLHPPLFEAHLDALLRAARGRPHVLYVDRPHNPRVKRSLWRNSSI